MDHPRNNQKKNTIKILPVGIGGIVLFAGAFVTATVVSSLAFKTRSQRRSSRSNKLDLELELTPDEKRDYVHSGDGNEDIIFSVVNEDQEINKLICDESGFQSEEQIDNEKDEHVDANSSVSEEGVESIQAHEEIEVLVKDIVSEASEDEDEEAAMEAVCVNQVKLEDNIQVEVLKELMAGNHEVASDAQEMRVNHVFEMCVDNQLTAKENSLPSRLMSDEEKGELFNEDAMQEHEAIEVNVKDIVSEDEDEDEEGDGHQERVFMNEAATMEVQCLEEIMVDQVCETFVDDQSIAKEDSPPSRRMNTEEKNELYNEDEKDQSTEAAMVGDQTHNPNKKLTNEEEKEKEIDVQVKVEMLKEHVMVKKDEIQHVQSIKEDEIPHVQSIKEQETVKKDEIQHVQSFKEDEMPHVQSIKEDEIPHVQSINEHEMIKKDEIQHVQSFQEDEIPHVQSINEHEMIKKDEIQDVQSFKEDEMPHVQLIKEQEMVKKNEIQHVQSIKEDEIPHVQSIKEQEMVKKDEIQHVQPFKQDEFPHVQSLEELKDSSMMEKLAFASEQWNLKLMIWCVMISVWCLCHWYSELPFLEVSLVSGLLFILILLGYKNRATYLMKL